MKLLGDAAKLTEMRERDLSSAADNSNLNGRTLIGRAVARGQTRH